jgi:hypothetical protein
MKAIDFRDATFERLRATLDARRAAVYTAWVALGPGTTREIAQRAQIDILSFRPRTTELLQMGLLTVAGGEHKGREGTYRATTAAEWQDWRGAAAVGQQMLI